LYILNYFHGINPCKITKHWMLHPCGMDFFHSGDRLECALLLLSLLSLMEDYSPLDPGGIELLQCSTSTHNTV
jgi:hypothetical protein